MQVQASIGAGIERRSQQASRSAETVTETAGTRLPAVIPAPARPALEHKSRVLPLATVVAQLAASAGDHPSTRARRRAGPAEGASLYGLAAAITPQAPKTIVRIL